MKRFKYTAFLTVLFFFPLFTGFPLEEGELGISAAGSPDNPVAGGSWTVTILVGHPVPREVTVKPPRFPPSLILERVRTESRLLTRPGRSDEAGPPADPARWTAVEFLFTLMEPGEIVLEPFEAFAGGRSAVTREISVRVREGAGSPRRRVPVFRWETPVPPLTAGAAAGLRLVLTGWERGKEAPRDFFKGKAPLNAILEEFPPAGPLSGGEFVYTLRIIPLEETGVVLESFSFQQEGVSLTVPPLSVRVRPAAASASPGAAPSAPPSPEPESGNIPFPKTGGRAFPFFRDEYERTLGDVKALWEAGRRAGALAEIRGKERESWAGPDLAALRREMEHSLGLGPTEDEKWRPRNMPVFFLPALSLFLIAAAFLFRSRFSAVTSGKSSGYKTGIILAAAAVFAVLLLVELSGNGGKGRGVLEKTAVYRVPEQEGTVSAFFAEGQPVITGASRGEWVYVESSGGMAGWVPAASVIRY